MLSNSLMIKLKIVQRAMFRSKLRLIQEMFPKLIKLGHVWRKQFETLFNLTAFLCFDANSELLSFLCEQARSLILSGSDVKG